MSNDLLDRWADDLQRWAIPDHILQQAPQSPWIHPVEKFTPAGDLMVATPSRLRALEAIEGLADASVLDVGCGGGRAAFGLTPPATSVVGVDHQQAMLDVFTAAAEERHVTSRTVLGDWPDVADETPSCDVVVCHHVLYNVQRIAPFLQALDAHAHRRVVIEMPVRHPLSHMADLWKHFWDLDRPQRPTADDALAIATSLGFDAHLELFETPPAEEPITSLDVEHMRIRLCLTPDRDAEVEQLLRSRPAQGRRLAALWWDVRH